MDQALHLANVVAETDCALLPINRSAFLALVQTSREFAASIPDQDVELAEGARSRG